MALQIQNDYGKWVYKVGSDGSFADTMNRYPKLTDRIVSLYHQRANAADAIDEIRQAGVIDESVTIMILTAAYFYPPNPETSACGLDEWNEKRMV